MTAKSITELRTYHDRIIQFDPKRIMALRDNKSRRVVEMRPDSSMLAGSQKILTLIGYVALQVNRQGSFFRS